MTKSSARIGFATILMVVGMLGMAAPAVVTPAVAARAATAPTEEAPLTTDAPVVPSSTAPAAAPVTTAAPAPGSPTSAPEPAPTSTTADGDVPSVDSTVPPDSTASPVPAGPAGPAGPGSGGGILLTPDPTGTIAIDKTNTADGEPAGDGGTVQPGDSFTYNFLASCSNINVDCVNLTVVDTFPAGVVVDESTIPASIPGFREVTWDGSDRSRSVYVEPLANPPGATGKLAGTSDSFNVTVTLPADTPLETGAVITERRRRSRPTTSPIRPPTRATSSSTSRASSASQPTKSFSDPSAIAGDPDATTTIQLGGSNQSSSSAEVTQMLDRGLDGGHVGVPRLHVGDGHAVPGRRRARRSSSSARPADAPCDRRRWVAGGTGDAARADHARPAGDRAGRPTSSACASCSPSTDGSSSHRSPTVARRRSTSTPTCATPCARPDSRSSRSRTTTTIDNWRHRPSPTPAPPRRRPPTHGVRAVPDPAADARTSIRRSRSSPTATATTRPTPASTP